MSRARAAGVLAATTLLLNGGCGGDGRTTPTQPTTVLQTRIIAMAGSLAFGDVDVGGAAERTITISNSGTAALTVHRLRVDGVIGPALTPSWTGGAVAPSASQTVVMRFVPTSPGTLSGVLTVEADHTSGSNTLAVSGTGTGSSVGGLWAGDYVIERCDGTGSIQELACSRHGSFPVGPRLPLQLALGQIGTSVTGMVALGSFSGTVTGSSTPAGALTLSGTATQLTGTLTIRRWETVVAGNGMTGTLAFDVTDRSLPGVAAVTARIVDMRR